VRLDVATHGSEFVRNDLVGEQGFAERVSCGCVGKGFGEAGTGFAVAAYGHDEALFIKVCHDDFEAVVFGAEEVAHGYMYVIELDEAGATAFLAAVGDAPVCEAGGGRGDDKHREARHAGAAGTDGRGHMCSPWHTSDPFLLAVDDVVCAIRGLLGGGLDVGDIGLGVFSFGD
jgi:hypothetical protein